MNRKQCPVCGFIDDDEFFDEKNHFTFNICSCCGCESGYQYQSRTEETLIIFRQHWAKNRFKWFSESEKPRNWNVVEQLKTLNLLDEEIERLIKISNFVNDDESGVRKIIYDSRGIQYKSYPSLEEAAKSPNSYLVMEGDYGGQIYLSIPVKKIKCSEETLKNLLEKIDELFWNDVNGRGLYYEDFNLNANIAGGMGGGKSEKDLWLHSKLNNLYKEIDSILKARLEIDDSFSLVGAGL